MKLLFQILIVLLILTSFKFDDQKGFADNQIIENKRIGKYSLTLSKKELDKFENATIDTLHRYLIYSIPNIKIWYDTIKNKTDQICAIDNFSGKFRNRIELNDGVEKLGEISKFYYWTEEEIYQFKSINGICFNSPEKQLELEISRQIIDCICVFRESKLKMRLKNLINRKDYKFENKKNKKNQHTIE